MTDQNNQDLLDAVASALTTVRDLDAQGIIIGYLPTNEAPRIDRIDYREGDKQIWLRLTNGEAWLLQVHKLGDRLSVEYNLGYADVRNSFKRYQAMVSKWQMIERTLAAGGMKGEEINLYLQVWHDDTLSDDERADYDRWVSGGYASAAEWDVVNG